jgi:hypothetical protein
VPPLLVPLLEPPPLEHAAAAMTATAPQAAAAILDLLPNLDELMERTSAMLI